MIKHLDYCTHILNPEDVAILKTQSFDVNLRLLKTSPGYKAIIQQICNYIAWSATTLKEGYSKPKGWSGPNAGIPFRIIYVPPYGIMINPVWISTDTKYEDAYVKSNCGSLTLPKTIQVRRDRVINIKYWTIDGQEHSVERMTKADGGYTFQHEYAHCNGELIK